MEMTVHVQDRSKSLAGWWFCKDVKTSNYVLLPNEAFLREAPRPGDN
jgi:hypothetical protein